MDIQPVLIVGTGAMACYFAARLSGAGIPVAMLGTWPEGLAALKANGVRLVHPGGTVSAYPVQVYAPADDLPAFGKAIVLVKSWQTSRTARQLQNCLTPDGFMLTLQNGLNNQETLSDILGSDRVLAGVTTTGASLAGPGQVIPGGEGVITLGKNPKVEGFRSLFLQANFEVETAADLDALLWRKLVVNAAINPLTALFGIENGALAKSESLHMLASDIARETAAVAQASSIDIGLPDPMSMVDKVIHKTASNRSSMLQDLERGAPTEVDAICGAIVCAAVHAGIDAPINRIVWRLIQSAVEIRKKENHANR